MHVIAAGAFEITFSLFLSMTQLLALGCTQTLAQPVLRHLRMGCAPLRRRKQWVYCLNKLRFG